MSKFSKILGSIVRYLVATVSLSVVLYILFALIFSTEEERRLQRENNLYKSLYKEIRNKDRLIGDVVDGLLVAKQCDGTMLVLKSEGVYAGDAIGLEGKVTWFEGDVTFRRSDGN